MFAKYLFYPVTIGFVLEFFVFIQGGLFPFFAILLLY